PWYLIWCLPFMVFAGRRSWFLLPGLVLFYYARFWFEAHGTTGNVDVFDYGLVWLEYMPFFVALALEIWWINLQTPHAVAEPTDRTKPPYGITLKPQSTMEYEGV